MDVHKKWSGYRYRFGCDFYFHGKPDILEYILIKNEFPFNI